MSIYEYNEEYVRKSLTETGYEQGKADGIRQGRLTGQAETLINSIEAVMRNLNLDLPKACEIIGTTQEEYTCLKQMENAN